jgi:hypothetical protein
MKVAYLLGPARTRHYTGPVTKRRYEFSPWCEVDEADWEPMKTKVIHITGCCGKPTRQMRVFGSADEVRDGLVGFSR